MYILLLTQDVLKCWIKKDQTEIPGQINAFCICLYESWYVCCWSFFQECHVAPPTHHQAKDGSKSVRRCFGGHHPGGRVKCMGCYETPPMCGLGTGMHTEKIFQLSLVNNFCGGMASRTGWNWWQSPCNYSLECSVLQRNDSKRELTLILWSCTKGMLSMSHCTLHCKWIPRSRSWSTYVRPYGLDYFCSKPRLRPPQGPVCWNLQQRKRNDIIDRRYRSKVCLEEVRMGVHRWAIIVAEARCQYLFWGKSVSRLCANLETECCLFVCLFVCLFAFQDFLIWEREIRSLCFNRSTATSFTGETWIKPLAPTVNPCNLNAKCQKLSRYAVSMGIFDNYFISCIPHVFLREFLMILKTANSVAGWDGWKKSEAAQHVVHKVAFVVPGCFHWDNKEKTTTTTTATATATATTTLHLMATSCTFYEGFIEKIQVQIGPTWPCWLGSKHGVWQRQQGKKADMNDRSLLPSNTYWSCLQSRIEWCGLLRLGRWLWILEVINLSSES